MGDAGTMSSLLKNVLAELGAAAVLALCVAAIYLIMRRGDAEGAKPKRQLGRSHLRWGYLFLALGFSTFAFYGSVLSSGYKTLELTEAIRQFQQLPLIPEHISRTDVATNVLLMMPVSFLWLGFLTVDRKSHWFKLLAVLLVFALCTTLAVANEFSQLWSVTRVASKTDIMAQVLGSLIGIVLWLLAGGALTDWLAAYPLSGQTSQKVIWLLEAYLIGFIIYNLMPFDLTISVSDLGHKLIRGQIEWIPFQHYPLRADRSLEIFRDIVVFIPIGMLATIWHCPNERPLRGWFDATALGVLAALAIELAQLFVQSRYTSITDVMMGSSGVMVGVTLTHFAWRGHRRTIQTGRQPWLLRSPSIWALIVVVYACVLVVPFWTPFDFTENRHLIHSAMDAFFRAPFASLRVSSTLNAFSIVLERLLWFAPLGVLLAVWASSFQASRTMHRVLLGVGLCVIATVALGIELGQLALPSRTADVTDVILATAGGWSGLLLAAWILPQTRGRGERTADERKTKKGDRR